MRVAAHELARFCARYPPFNSPSLTTVSEMGRPRIHDEPRIATAIRLPATLHEELRAAAAERDVSVNVLVNRAVQTYLRLEPATS